MENIGYLVKAIREGLWLNQADFATLLGCSRQFISLVERDKSTFSEAMMARMVKAVKEYREANKAKIETIGKAFRRESNGR